MSERTWSKKTIKISNFISLLTILLISGCSSTPPTWFTYLENARDCCAEEKFTETEEWLSEALKTVKTGENPTYCPGPGLPGSLSGEIATLGSMYASKGKPDRAEQLFKLAISIQPEFIYKEGLAELYESRGNYSAAEKLWEELLLEEKKYNFEHPKTPFYEILFKLGACLAAQKKFGLADGYYKECILAIENSHKHFNFPVFKLVTMGDYFLSRNDSVQAQKCYELAIAMEPPDTNAKAGLADVLLSEDKIVEASILYDQALKGSMSLKRQYKTRKNYAKVLNKLNRQKESREMEESAERYNSTEKKSSIGGMIYH